MQSKMSLMALASGGLTSPVRKEALWRCDKAANCTIVDRIDSANSSPPAETSKQDETNTEPEEWGFRVPIAGVTSSHTAPDDMQSSKTTWEVEPLRRYVSAG